MKKLICFLILLAICLTGVAQSYEKTNTGIKTNVNTISIEIQYYSPSIVRILKSKVGNIIEKNSLSVIKSPEQIDLKVENKGDIITVKSKILTVNLNLKDGKINFSSSKGTSLLREKDPGNFTDFIDAGISTTSAFQSFSLDIDEAYIWSGSAATG